MNTNNFKRVCFDYFSGKATENEAREIREFLAEDEANRVMFRSWEKEWSRDFIPTFSQIREFDSISGKIRRRKNNRIIGWASGAIAAAACLVLVVTTTFGLGNQERYLCAVGTSFCERTEVVLPDSTHVWLNAASKITYNPRTFVNDRQVKLEGEAFFDVTHQAGAPFVVNMNGGSIKVLGTKFNVSSYAGEPTLFASLLEGSIEFEMPGTTVLMKPGETVTCNTVDGSVLKTKSDVSKSVSWMDGRLQYDMVMLKPLLSRLSSIYGTTINYTPWRLVRHNFTVDLNLSEDLPNILDALGNFLPIRWRYESDGSITVTETNI